MKVLMVSDFYRPGHSRLLEEYCRGLDDRGHEVTLFAGQDEPSVHREQESLGSVSVQLFRYDPDERFPGSYLNFRRNLLRACEELTRHSSFDAVVTNQPLSAWFVLSRLPENLPAVHFFHSPWAEDWQLHSPAPSSGITRFLYPAYRVLNELVRRRIERSVLQRVDRIICLSDYMNRRARSHHPDLTEADFKNIPGGANTSQFHPDDREGSRKRINVDPDRTLLLTIRRLVPRMGVDLLIDAFGRISGNRDSLKLIVGGDGPERPSLERRAESIDGDVEFRGYVPEREIADYYRAADLFVLPTRELEGFGLVTVEAMACGTPVAATRKGASPEIIEPFLEDLLLDGMDPQRWSDQLADLLDDTVGKQSLRERCREYILSNYRWQDRVTQLENLLQSLT